MQIFCLSPELSIFVVYMFVSTVTTELEINTPISFSDIKYEGIDKTFQFYMFEYSDVSGYYTVNSKCPNILLSSFNILSDSMFISNLPCTMNYINEILQKTLNTNDYQKLIDFCQYLKHYSVDITKISKSNNTISRCSSMKRGFSNLVEFEGQIHYTISQYTKTIKSTVQINKIVEITPITPSQSDTVPPAKIPYIVNTTDLIQCFNQRDYNELDSIFILCDIDDGLDGYSFECGLKQFDSILNMVELNIIDWKPFYEQLLFINSPLFSYISPIPTSHSIIHLLIHLNSTNSEELICPCSQYFKFEENVISIFNKYLRTIFQNLFLKVKLNLKDDRYFLTQFEKSECKSKYTSFLFTDTD